MTKRRKTQCIFCLRPTRNEPPEHIMPEGLVGSIQFGVTLNDKVDVGDTTLILDGNEVCKRCNTGKLSLLDGYLQKQLGILKVFFNWTRTKKGRPAKFESPGIFVQRRNGGPFIVINDEVRAITTDDGIRVQPPASDMSVRVRVDPGRGSVAINQSVRMNKRFVRALYKIAFELLCQRKGPSYVTDPRFDTLRRFVLLGEGNRLLMIRRGQMLPGQWEKPILELHRQGGTDVWLCRLRFGQDFHLDLLPSNLIFRSADPRGLERAGFVLWTGEGGGRVA